MCQGLSEVADGARDILIAVNAQGNNRDEAEREPRMAFDDRGGPVALESVRSAREVGKICIKHVRSYGTGIAGPQRLRAPR